LSAHCEMEYLPPVVIEDALPAGVDLDGIMPGIHFRRGKDSVGADYDIKPGVLIGAHYGDTAHIVTGSVHDSRWTFKVTVRF
jgi:hypothetical protein